MPLSLQSQLPPVEAPLLEIHSYPLHPNRPSLPSSTSGGSDVRYSRVLLARLALAIGPASLGNVDHLAVTIEGRIQTVNF